MTTRDDEAAAAAASASAAIAAAAAAAAAPAENSDRELTTNSINANRLSTNQNSGMSTNTSNGTHTKNWFRSIQRRIRKFITKHQYRHMNTSAAPSGSTSLVTTTSDAVFANETFVGDGDGADESNLYSLVDYLGNDEEVAMIRACSQMARYGWFWGPISRHTAQQRLHGTPNGSFLVRNSQINLHNFTVSFRTAGKTLHYRIEFVDGFWQTFSSRHRSIVDLIDDAMKISKENVFCYVKQNSQLLPPYPVRLTNPISHFGDISSLQNMCRMVIQKNIDIGKMDMLPLPNKLISYCKEWETIYGEMPIRIG